MFGDLGELMGNGRDVLSDAVAEALDGHCCASGWLGYANVLFLGFGDAPMPWRTNDGGRTLRVDPWLDPDEARWDAWSISLPGRLVAVSCGGRVAAPDPQCPVGQW